MAIFHAILHAVDGVKALFPCYYQLTLVLRK